MISTHASFMLRLFLIPSILVTVQLYHAVSIRQHITAPTFRLLNHSIDEFKPLPTLSANESFGACLMIKEDNDLLYEWLAYHYTVLPLRYVFVGSDEGNRQDPTQVLHRWNIANTKLQYWVVNASDFTSSRPPGKFTGSSRRQYSVEHEEAHHSFVHRQRGFITKCVQFLKSQGLHWVIFIDTDEFLVMNRLHEEEKKATMHHNDLTDQTANKSVQSVAYRMRHSLPPIESDITVVDTIRRLERIDSLGSCYTMPRLLYGALENVTCFDAAAITQVAQSKFHYSELSTLRFTQHARKGDFAKSKYGKVMMNLSRLSNETMTRTPKNIHCPYKPECKPGASGNFAESSFYLNHYIGSWERYASRQDSRRNREEWELRAHLTAENSCQHAVYEWFPRFLNLVGQERAEFLLGVKNTIS